FASASTYYFCCLSFFFQAEDGIRDRTVTGVQTCALPIWACALAVLAAPALVACGDTLQAQPIAHNTLETLLVAPYPVYWLGRSFKDLQITEASHDPGGAFSVQYGNCVEGGQGTCVPPLRVVTSPDNSFLPVGGAAHRT